MPASPHITDFADGISAIDTEYIRTGLDASHLIVDHGEAAFVDTGTAHSVPLLLGALAQKGLRPEQVRYVCVTHVHLDHAGGAGTLMQALPHATLVVHPRGARHMIDPARLMAGTRAVYGEARAAELYGELVPVDAQRVHTVEDESRLPLGARTLRFLDTPGHAYHHYCIVDEAANAIFTGDSFGLSYRELDTPRGAFIFPTTTPVHFDPEAAHASIDRLMALAPQAMYLTHYSRVDAQPRLAQDLHEALTACVEIAQRHAGKITEHRHRAIAHDLHAWLGERLTAHGTRLNAAQIDDIISMDVELNTQGLCVWLDGQGKQ